MTNKPKLTQWFKGVKPVRKGVYQQRTPWGVLGYQRWQADGWYGWCETAEEAAREPERAHESYQNDPWRGLAKNPAPGAGHGDA